MNEVQVDVQHSRRISAFRNYHVLFPDLVEQ